MRAGLLSGVGFLLALAIWFTPVAVAHDDFCPYSLTLAKTQFTRHEPILLKLVITNSSAEPLPVSLGYDREGAFLFTVRRPDGSVIELPRKQVREGLSLVGKFTLAAGQSHTQQLILNEWYDFPEVGVYEIAASLAAAKGADRVCLDARFAVEITPLDTAQLQQTCSELVETIRRNRNNVANAFDAAKALLVIKQPLAAPFLEEAFKANGAVDWLMISGLEQIGDKQTLSRIQQQTTNPDTLELINAALARVKN